jgi:hypothetical protein
MAKLVANKVTDRAEAPTDPSEQYKLLGLWRERVVDRLDLLGGAVILTYDYKCLRCGVKIRLEIG